MGIEEETDMGNTDDTTRALQTLNDYRRWSLVSESEYKRVKRQIKDACSDDEVSGIMCRLRHRIYA